VISRPSSKTRILHLVDHPRGSGGGRRGDDPDGIPHISTTLRLKSTVAVVSGEDAVGGASSVAP
jgi:hypothetical protein